MPLKLHSSAAFNDRPPEYRLLVDPSCSQYSIKYVSLFVNLNSLHLYQYQYQLQSDVTWGALRFLRYFHQGYNYFLLETFTQK